MLYCDNIVLNFNLFFKVLKFIWYCIKVFIEYDFKVRCNVKFCLKYFILLKIIIIIKLIVVCIEYLCSFFRRVWWILDNYDVFVGEGLRSCDINYDWGNVKI